MPTHIIKTALSSQDTTTRMASHPSSTNRFSFFMVSFPPWNLSKGLVFQGISSPENTLGIRPTSRLVNEKPHVALSASVVGSEILLDDGVPALVEVGAALGRAGLPAFLRLLLGKEAEGVFAEGGGVGLALAGLDRG